MRLGSRQGGAAGASPTRTLENEETVSRAVLTSGCIAVLVVSLSRPTAAQMHARHLARLRRVSGRVLPVVQPNANTARAGVLHDGVLTVALEAKESTWRLDRSRERGKEHHRHTSGRERRGKYVIEGLHVVYDVSRLDRAHGTAHVSHHGAGSAARAQHEGHTAGGEGHELVREAMGPRRRPGVGGRGADLLPLHALHVCDDADDLRLDIEAGDVDVSADRVLAREVQSRERVVDIDDDGSVLVVGVGHESPAFERHSHCAAETF